MILRNYLVLLLLSFITFPFLSYAQEKSDKTPIRFGRISPGDFSLPAASFDSSAAAVVIADIGSSAFEGNSQGWFTLEFKHTKRIKILNKRGFDAATVRIPLYVAGTETERINGLKAVTYNLENGKIEETRLDDKSVFEDKISKHYIEKKFTFPAIKEGSIIEYSYTQTSPFLFNLQPWEFQGEYPCLWSEYEVAMPDFFQYVTLSQGYLNFDIKTQDERNVTFSLSVPGTGGEKSEPVTFTDKVVDHRWVIRSAPALKEESYTTTINNYLDKLEFQLSRYEFPNSAPQDKMGNWFSVSKALMEDNDFGADLGRNNGWLDEDMKKIIQGTHGKLETAKKIYAFIRDQFTCTSHGSLYATNSLKTVFKNRNGNEAELNLLLTAMLRHENINADPIILSTRSHGFTHEMYPLLTRFNYVISRAVIDSSTWYLDASEHWLAFGRLPQSCYNGHARIINEQAPMPVYLEADSMKERKFTLVFLTKGQKGGVEGHLQSKPGYFESCVIREKVKEKGQPDFFKTIQTSYPSEDIVSGLEFDSLSLPDEPLAVAYDLKINMDTSSDLFYFTPLLAEGYKENPFKATNRVYPVEMPYTMDETYTLNMEIPDGYTVDELPKSVKVALNSDEGYFEYLVAQSGEMIQFRSRVQLNKANYKPEDYPSLRDFFGFVVKKQSEQIVFKKKKA